MKETLLKIFFLSLIAFFPGVSLASTTTPVGLLFAVPQGQANSTTYYCPIGSFGCASTSENSYVLTYKVPDDGILKNLYLRSANSVGANTVGTVRVNTSDTALTATIGNGQNTASNLTDEVTVSRGDTITVKLVTGTGTVPDYTGFSMELATTTIASTGTGTSTTVTNNYITSSSSSPLFVESTQIDRFTDHTQTNLFYAFIIFALCAGSVIWIFKSHS